MFIFHADDYGVNISQCKRMMDCRKMGGLNSVSIFGNSQILDEAVEMLDEGCLRGIHLNFREGKACSKKEKIPLLVDYNGRLCNSFFHLLWLSIIHRERMEREIEVECMEQIIRVLQKMPKEYRIRIDSHQHIHMIPAVFRGMCKALKKIDREVEYIRFPVENICLYIRTPGVWKHIRLINVIKALVLGACCIINRRTMKKFGYSNCGNTVFIGVLFTGNMTRDKVFPLLTKLKGREDNVEVLFHPGGVMAGEEFIDPYGLTEFYMSESRRIEADTLMKLKGFIAR